MPGKPPIARSSNCDRTKASETIRTIVYSFSKNPFYRKISAREAQGDRTFCALECHRNITMFGAAFISCNSPEKFILDGDGHINALAAIPERRQCCKCVCFSSATFAADRPLTKATCPFGSALYVVTTLLTVFYWERIEYQRNLATRRAVPKHLIHRSPATKASIERAYNARVPR
jgi:hypothetical protein